MLDPSTTLLLSLLLLWPCETFAVGSRDGTPPLDGNAIELISVDGVADTLAAADPAPTSAPLMPRSHQLKSAGTAKLRPG